MSLNDLIHIILFNRKKIIQITFISTVLLFLILYFVYPVTYKSTVSVLPPEKSNDIGGLSSLISGSDFSSILRGGFANVNSQLFAEILKSRSASLHVIRKLNLTDILDAENENEAAEKLSKKLNINLNKEGILKLSVDVNSSWFPMIFSDKEYLRKLAAEISNEFIVALDIINRDKLSSKAKSARIYIERQLEETRANLDSAETLLMEFQQKNKTIALPEQLKSAIEAAAELKSEIVKTEIELGLLKYNVREESRAYTSLSKKLQQLNTQYSKLAMGNEDYMIAFKDVPDLGRELAGLVREVKIQNEVYILLQQQYFKEKIQENRDISTIEILDEAIVPDRPSSPRKLYSSIVGAVFFFLAVSLFFIFNNRKFYLAKKESYKN